MPKLSDEDRDNLEGPLTCDERKKVLETSRLINPQGKMDLQPNSIIISLNY